MGRRRHLRRAIGLALVALVVWFLLHANRLLPGSWPGGGDSGSRSTPAGSSDDPTRVREAGTPPPPTTRRSEPIRIVVRANDGSVVPDATIRWRTPEGVVPVVGGQIHPASVPNEWGLGQIEVRRPPHATVVRHTVPPPNAPRTWTVAWPEKAPSAERGLEEPGFEPDTVDATRFGAKPLPRLLTVHADGKPLPGAAVTVESGDRDLALVTDGTGSVELDRRLGLYRARVTAAGRAEAVFYGTTYAPDRIVEVDRLVKVATRFVEPGDRAPLGATSVRVVSADGTAREIERVGETIPGFDASIPASLAASQRLEVEVAGRPVVRVRLADVGPETVVPTGRVKRLLVRDESGVAVAGARVEARYAAPAGHEPLEAAEPVTSHVTDVEGRVAIPLPADRGADLVVLSDRHAPYGVRSEPGDVAEATVTLDAGVVVAVEVADAAGKPVGGADVMGIARAGPTSARRRTRTGADGRASLPPVSTGRLEIYVHEPGLVWGWAVVDATASTPPVRFALAPGKRLHVVVDDENGVPLAGVRVRAQAPDSATGAAIVVDPDDAPWVTDEHGTLVVEDLSGGPLDLALSKDGYENETVRGFVPEGVWLATMARTVR